MAVGGEARLGPTRLRGATARKSSAKNIFGARKFENWMTRHFWSNFKEKCGLIKCLFVNFKNKVYQTMINLDPVDKLKSLFVNFKIRHIQIFYLPIFFDTWQSDLSKVDQRDCQRLSFPKAMHHQSHRIFSTIVYKLNSFTYRSF